MFNHKKAQQEEPKEDRKKRADAKNLPEGLVQSLIDNEHVETAYVNEEATQWHFHKRPGFYPIDRDEVLGAND